jgi:betaine-aldehyde dehydrogenase
VGDPADERTQMGPLITAKHREASSAMCAGRVRRRPAAHRRRAPRGRAVERGYYYTPTILEGVNNAAHLPGGDLRPGAGGHALRRRGRLIEQANDSVYALAAGIWTRDYKRAWRIGRAVQAGTVWINTYKQFSISTPFGGWRDSGLGREKGWASSSTWSRRACTGA